MATFQAQADWRVSGRRQTPLTTGARRAPPWLGLFSHILYVHYVEIGFFQSGSSTKRHQQQAPAGHHNAVAALDFVLRFSTYVVEIP